MKSLSPELVDLKITNFCPYGCIYCYQSSTPKGQHADLDKIKSIISELARLRVFEIAFGGGEPTLHPDFEEMVEFCTTNHIVPNFSTRNTNCLKNARLLSLIGAVAYSVDTPAEVKKIYAICQDNLVPPKKLNIQTVLGATSYETLKDILDICHKFNIRITLLGYKNVGFGRNVNYEPYKWLPDLLDSLIKNNKCPILGVDTAVIAEFRQELVDIGISPILFSSKEGETSCYIDALESKIRPSSYCEESKMVPLTIEKINDIFATF